MSKRGDSFREKAKEYRKQAEIFERRAEEADKESESRNMDLIVAQDIVLRASPNTLKIAERIYDTKPLTQTMSDDSYSAWIDVIPWHKVGAIQKSKYILMAIAEEWDIDEI